MKKDDVPFRADFSAGTDVVLSSEHELVVQHPLGLMVQTRGWMDVHSLVVLHCQVEPTPLQMRHLQTHSYEYCTAENTLVCLSVTIQVYSTKYSTFQYIYLLKYC